VSACASPNRKGFEAPASFAGFEFGLLVSSEPLSPFTAGVPGKAVNLGSPGKFSACGYVPKIMIE
jgi:hypothetical protein